MHAAVVKSKGAVRALGLVVGRADSAQGIARCRAVSMRVDPTAKSLSALPSGGLAEHAFVLATTAALGGEVADVVALIHHWVE